MKTTLVAALLAGVISIPSQAAVVSRAVEQALARGERVRVIALLDQRGRSAEELARTRVEVIHSNSLTGVTNVWQSVPGFTAVVDAAALDRLRKDPRVATVEHDGDGRFLSIPGQSAPAAHAPELLGYDGSGVTVAVLDSGVTSSHADLRNAVVAERCYCRDELGRPCCPDGTAEQDGPGSARDDAGHGTYVAATIASSGTVGPRGIAPGVKVIGIRVTDSQSNVTWTSQVVSAIDWILTERPEVRVVNMSFSLGEAESGACDATQPAMREAIRRLRARGVTVVSATGNTGTTTGVNPPACISGVISVGAVHPAHSKITETFGCTDAAAESERVACFSNGGARLDLLAPGVGIPSARVDGKPITSSGTSFAAPTVAAAAALLLQKNPTLTPDEIELLLKSTGRSLIDTRTGSAYPRVDLRAALDATPEAHAAKQ
jgi:subtilisin